MFRHPLATQLSIGSTGKALHDKIGKGVIKPKTEKAHVVFSRATVGTDVLVLQTYPIGDPIDLQKTEDHN